MRLIDADKLIESMSDRYNEKVNNVPDNLAEGFMQMEKLIKEQPTAYDVDKVCEELQSYKDDIRQWNDTYTSGQISAYEKAIAVVKAGGRDD